jgi:hypothetical protein
MSPTSYQAAPPRTRSVAEQHGDVKFWITSLGTIWKIEKTYLRFPKPLEAAGAGEVVGSLMSMAQRGKA